MLKAITNPPPVEPLPTPHGLALGRVLGLGPRRRLGAVGRFASFATPFSRSVA
jgi:hypothetical protein